MNTNAKIEEVLRRIGEVRAAASREGKVVPPDLARVASALSAKLQNGHGAPQQLIDTVQPTPPPITLPPQLEQRWDHFQQYFAAMNQEFGWPTRDQWLWLAEVAATLVDARTHTGSIESVWEIFIEVLKQLCEMLGHVNEDQYLWVLDIAAHLTGAEGLQGDPGDTPEIGANGNWWIGGVDTGVPARGQTPFIGGNGNWWIGTTDTGYPAQGPPGPQGVPGEGITILGYFDTLDELEAAHPTGNVGDIYIVGSELYVWDEATQSWRGTHVTAGIPEAPDTVAQPYVRDGLTESWVLLSIDGGTWP